MGCGVPVEWRIRADCAAGAAVSYGAGGLAGAGSGLNGTTGDVGVNSPVWYLRFP